MDGPFDHRFIEDVKKNQFFDCTVEVEFFALIATRPKYLMHSRRQVLHADYNPNGLSHIYVTDYTRHADLPVVPASCGWSHGLEKRIVKVVLWDEQMAMAKNVQSGWYCTIRKLRLMQSTTGGQFQGRLGGSERLIHRLKSANSNNARLVSLLL